jgi:hypothetical protein
MRGILGEKMHAPDNGIGLEHVLLAGRPVDQRYIVDEAERAGRGERREEARIRRSW